MLTAESSWRRRAVVLCFFCGLHAVVDAGDWTIRPRFAVDQTVTDNARQSEVDPHSDLITDLRPGISIRSESARLNSNVDYNFQQSLFAKDSDLDSGNHQLQGHTTLEVIPDHLTVDADSTMSQQLSDSQGIVSLSNRSRNGNRSNVTTYSVRPRYRTGISNWAVATYEFGFDSVSFDDRRAQNSGLGGGANFGDTRDSEELSHQLTLETGSRFARIPSSVTYETYRTKYADGRVDRLRSLTADLSYVFNRKFRLTTSFGEDSNDYQRSRLDAQDGFRWSAGGVWTPTERTEISGNYGERFFGANFNAKLRHEHRRWNVSFDYSERVSSNNRFQRGVELVPLFDGFGGAVLDPLASSQFPVPLDTPSLRPEIYVTRRMSTDFNYRFRRGIVRLGYTETERDFQASGVTESIDVLTASFDRPLSPRTSFSTRVLWRKAAQQGSGAGDLVNISPSLRYTLGPDVTLRLSYTYEDQASGDGGRNGFTEHSLVAGLVYDF